MLERTAVAADESIAVHLPASAESPLYHPAFIIKAWGAQPAQVTVNGREYAEGREVATGIRRTLERDDLIIWLDLVSEEPVELTVGRAGSAGAVSLRRR